MPIKNQQTSKNETNEKTKIRVIHLIKLTGIKLKNE